MIKKFISFFFPIVSISNLDFFGVGYDLTESYFESYYDEDSYAMGLLNYTDDRGFLEWDMAEQFLEEYHCTLEDYESETNDENYSTIGIVQYVGI